MRGRPRNEQRRLLEAETGYSARHVQRLLKELGADQIKDKNELAAFKMRVEIGLKSLASQHNEHKLLLARRDVIPRSEAVEQGIKLAEIVNRLSSEAITNWPTELAGKTELQVREIVSQVFGEFNERFLTEAQAL